jgi:phosphoglycerol transferase MdoB-like AlkP superfamily enzyme
LKLDHSQDKKLNNVESDVQDLKSARKAEHVRRRMEEEELIRRARKAAEKMQKNNQFSDRIPSRPRIIEPVVPQKQEVKKPEPEFVPEFEPFRQDTVELEESLPDDVTLESKEEAPVSNKPVPERKQKKKESAERTPRSAEVLSGRATAVRLILGLILIIGISALITYMALLLQQAPSDGIKTLNQPFDVLFLNYLPIALTMLVLTLALWNVGYGGGLTAFIWLAMSLANTLKIQARDEALAFQDIFLLKEGLSATRHYALHVPVLLIFLSANLVLVLFFLGRVFRSRKRMKRYWPVRIISTVLAVILAVTVVKLPMASKDRFESFDIENEFYVTGIYNQLGFPYCFTYYMTKNNAVRPDNYSENSARNFETEPAYGQGKDVNVIVVMNESFTDLSDNEIFNYPASEDPLKNYHALQKDENAFSGHIVVHWIGGGTANTEYDVTTGMQTEMLDSSSASAFRYVKNDTASIFRVFNGDGYRTMFIHPGDAWFYNRENVYPRLGAQEVLFTDDMKGLEMKGEWVTDDSLADYVFQEFEDTVEKGDNLFAYVTTIQNHMSYDYGKYGDGYTFKKVYTDKEVSYDNRAYLPVYMEGIYDADASLKKMTDYFSQREEPVVLVFFGDHFPALGADREVYKELGLPMADETGNSSDDPFCAYEPPYLVWANDSAAEELDFERTVKSLDLPEDGIISANYLGAVLLELTGRGEEDSFFQYLNEMRRELPVVSGGRYKDADGNIITKLSEDQKELVSKLQRWSYYRLTNQFGK